MTAGAPDWTSNSEPVYAVPVRLSLVLLLGILVFQSAVSPLVMVEECQIQELRHADDECPPLCVTCGCCPAGHAFQAETVRQSFVGANPELASLLRPSTAPDAPPREILHVPLAAAPQ